MVVRFAILLASMCMLVGCSATDDILSASRECDLKGVKTAIAKKVDVNTHWGAGHSTPLMVASGNGCSQVVRFLLANGADANAAANDGMTPLMLAASQGNPEVVQMLVSAGAKVNAKWVDGRTALTDAAVYGQPDAARILIAAGADVNPNGDGETPLESTRSSASLGTVNGHQAVADILIKNGARR